MLTTSASSREACRRLLDQFTENDIAHREADGRQRDGAIAELMNEVVVATATGDRAELSRPIESLKNNAGIIGEPAHDREIDFDEFGQAALRQVAHQLIELFAPSASVENFENWIGQRSQTFSRFLPRLAFAFVDHLKQLAPAIFGYILRSQQVGPKFAIAQPNDHVIRGKTEGAQQVDQERDQFDIRSGRSVADDVAIELEMFAQPAALLFFVAETLGDGEPLERFAEPAFMRCDDPGECRRELGPHRDFAVASIGEIEKLRDDFGAALFLVKLGRLEDWAVPFDKAVAAADLAPARENGIPKGAVVRQEISKSGKWLHGKRISRQSCLPIAFRTGEKSGWDKSEIGTTETIRSTKPKDKHETIRLMPADCVSTAFLERRAVCCRRVIFFEAIGGHRPPLQQDS